MIKTIVANEYLLSVNDINQPLLVKDHDKVILFIIRLLLLEPGTYQSNPNMGVGLVSRYRYGNETEINSLATVVQEQIRTYLPGYDTVDVQITPNYEQKILNIQIVLNDVAYELTYDTEHEKIKL